MESFINKIKDILHIKPKSSLNFNRRRGPKNLSTAKYVGILAGEIIGCILLAFILAYTFFSGYTIGGISMSPTLEAGNRIFVNRTKSVFSPERGDVIAFEIQNGQNVSVNIKRVVAIPGDSVYISGGKLYVNGQEEENDTGNELVSIENAGLAKNEITLHKDEFFLLGDNRNSSEDSRFETVGVVQKSSIIGSVWLCYSFSNFGLVR